MAQRGDTVTARLFYDTTREDTLTGVSLTSEIPEGFSYVAGSTRNVLAPGTDVLAGGVSGETKASPVADSVWSGDTVTVSPSAGFNGESNASRQGFLRSGVKRYLNLHQCDYMRNGDQVDRYISVIENGPWSAGTNVSNTADTAENCGPGQGGWALHDPGSNVGAFDLLGTRYFNLHSCDYIVGDGSSIGRYRSVVPGGAWGAGSNMANTADTAADCGPGAGPWEQWPAGTGVGAFDFATNRYLNLHACDYMRDGEDFRYRSVIAGGSWGTGTNASDTADTTPVCGPGENDWSLWPAGTGVAPLDLVDTARGQGFIEFRMTSEVPEAPACGETVTEPEVVSDREGAMTGAGTGTPTSTATVTLAEYTAAGAECPETVLMDDEASTIDDDPVVIPVQDNDTIPDGSTGWEVDTSTAKGGTVVDNGDGTVTYTRPPGFHGTDTFTYRVTGPDGVEYEATVTVTITDEDGNTPMIAPGMAAVTLLGAGLLTAIRRRRAA